MRRVVAEFYVKMAMNPALKRALRPAAVALVLSCLTIGNAGAVDISPYVQCLEKVAEVKVILEAAKKSERCSPPPQCDNIEEGMYSPCVMMASSHMVGSSQVMSQCCIGQFCADKTGDEQQNCAQECMQTMGYAGQWLAYNSFCPKK